MAISFEVSISCALYRRFSSSDRPPRTASSGMHVDVVVEPAGQRLEQRRRADAHRRVRDRLLGRVARRSLHEHLLGDGPGRSGSQRHVRHRDERRAEHREREHARPTTTSAIQRRRRRRRAAAGGGAAGAATSGREASGTIGAQRGHRMSRGSSRGGRRQAWRSARSSSGTIGPGGCGCARACCSALLLTALGVAAAAVIGLLALAVAALIDQALG